VSNSAKAHKVSQRVDTTPRKARGRNEVDLLRRGGRNATAQEWARLDGKRERSGGEMLRCLVRKRAATLIYTQRAQPHGEVGARVHKADPPPSPRDAAPHGAAAPSPSK
jgi:hypothetical protein